MISLYHDTLTKDSFCAAQEGVMQLLTPAHKHLVPILGKRSGYEEQFSKQDACRDAGMAWMDQHEWDLAINQKDDDGVSPTTSGSSPHLSLLPNCASYLHFKLQSTVEAGDHLVTLCELMSTGTWDDDAQTIKRRSDNDVSVAPMDHANVLYTGLLRKEGII